MISIVEEEFYGRVIYAALRYAGPWESALPSTQAGCIKAAKAARAAVYVDPVQEVADKLYAACNDGIQPRGKAGGDYLAMARAAIAMGAKP